MKLEFDVISWGAWNPLFSEKQTWISEQITPSFNDTNTFPALLQFNKMQKRRFSRLTKLMLSVAFDCVDTLQCPAVFASRHGELTRTVGLLEDIAKKESLSPIAFSQSVHNTSSGLFSILQKNTHAFTSIAAMDQTLVMAAAETFSQVITKNIPVLLTFAQEPVPDIYKHFFEINQETIALAMLLDQKSEVSGVKLALTNILPEPTPDTIHYTQLMNAIAKEQELHGLLEGWYWHVYKE